MNLRQPLPFSRRNTLFLCLCLGGLTLLFLISVMPLKARHHTLDQEIVTLEKELASQQQQQATIGLIDGILSKLDQQPSPRLTPHAPLPQDKSGRISEDIKSIARESTLELAAIEPLLDKKESWETLTVRAELQGQFPDLRTFLLKLLALPYVKQIDHLEIHPGETGLKFTLIYTIGLA